MPREIRFLTADDVIRAHAFAMRALGLYPRPLRSRSLLEGAISRVPTAYNYQSMTIPEMAALTALSISQAQAFIDGNKRTAYSSLLIFCLYNGYEYVGGSIDLAVFLVVQANASEHSMFCKHSRELQIHDDDPADVALRAMVVWLERSIMKSGHRAQRAIKKSSRFSLKHPISLQLPLVEDDH